MERHHTSWLVFLGFMAIMGGMLVRGAQDVRLAYEHNLGAKLQANLLAMAVDTDKRIVEQEPIEILLVGDIMLGRGVEKIMSQMDDYVYPFNKVTGLLDSADIVFANLEGPISDRGISRGSKYSFRFNPKIVEGLKEAGFDVLSIANNHIMDWGQEALTDTRYFLEMSTIEAVGAGRDEEEANREVIIEEKGTRIAWLAYTDLYPDSLEAWQERGGVSDLDLTKIAKKIKDLKRYQGVDLVFVSLHWGEEYQEQANEEQKDLAQALVERGVDLIIGHHPHVTQEVEKVGNSWVAYSLGNFVFDQNFSEQVREGMILKVSVQDKEISELEIIKTKIGKGFVVEVDN